MFCDACGFRNREEARYCKSCGGPLAPGTAGAADGGETVTDLRTAPESSVPEALRRALSGSYDVEKQIGRGGMGAVYLATEMALERPVALKTLLGAGEAQSVKRFIQEARLAAKLRHPNIVSIHTVGEAAGIYYFTMDYIDGETLSQHVQRRQTTSPLTTLEAEAIVRAIAAGVAHAHSHGVVHRDLKPANVMIERSGHVLVMDFGLAKAPEQSGLTSEGVVVGTPRYISPEQIQGRPATPQSDMYALGLIYYFLLTGEELIRGDSLTEVVAQHLQRDPAPAIEGNGRIPAASRPLLLALLHKDPAARPRRLEGLFGTASSPSPPAELTIASRPAPSPSPAPPRAIPAAPHRKQAREKMRGLLDKLEKKKDE